ncbi:MAG TPA: nickel pincer cofactor biosynthesis protein LarC [Nitrospiraceae bacterium]|nr:nickel pincer cofactor biosynthesis protein LarC [Nitrospiraceae bacterium]
MRHLHFDCFSGISGDMTLGALVDAGLPLKELSRALKDLPAMNYRLRSARVMRGGLPATKVDVVIQGGFHSPLALSRIQRLITSSRLPRVVKEQSLAVFDRLANAEGLAHRVSPSKVTFHEVGVIDSLVDVVGSIVGCHLLGIQRITSSAVNLGSGFIDSAHGRLPAPGPAVAALAHQIPVYSSGPARELTTPTGLALLRTLAQQFGPLPLMRPTAIGYGAGSADPQDWPNALRIFVGDSVSITDGTDTIVQLDTNVDDLHPQVYETVMDRLFSAGAVDVALTPAIMKHARPGIVLTALTPRAKAQAVTDVLLRDTSTLGVRMQEVHRVVLPRRIEAVKISGGTIRMKVADLRDGHFKAAPEYQDCKRLADQTGRPIREIMEDAAFAYRQTQGKSHRAKANNKK